MPGWVTTPSYLLDLEDQHHLYWAYYNLYQQYTLSPQYKSYQELFTLDHDVTYYCHPDSGCRAAIFFRGVEGMGNSIFLLIHDQTVEGKELLLDRLESYLIASGYGLQDDLTLHLILGDISSQDQTKRSLLVTKVAPGADMYIDMLWLEP